MASAPQPIAAPGPPATARASMPASATAVRRIAIVGADSWSLVRARGSLIRAIVAQGHGVMCLAPDYEAADGAALDLMGVERRTLPARAEGFQLFPDRSFVVRLAEEFASWRPHAVLISGPNALQVARAARKGKVRRIVALVSGLPAAAAGNDRALRSTADLLLQVDSAIFHNRDDVASLKQRRLLPGDLAYTVVPGAGVDLARHGVQPLPKLSDGLTFLMVSRLDRDRGVMTYCEAARLLKARAPNARFLLAGPPITGRSALAVSLIEAYRDCVSYLGPVDDIRGVLTGCHVYVYPSFAEGMPLSVLEAMAAGRPIITSATAGCRDTVDERVNGCLVQPGDPVALAGAMESFLKRPDLIPAIARASRAKAERRFDERDVHRTVMAVLDVPLA
jgi:glycosyltransferase involved in cell wall biosynthesis